LLLRGVPAGAAEADVRAVATRFGPVDNLKLAPDLGGASVAPGSLEAAHRRSALIFASGTARTRSLSG
jgi:hypothetical protein